MAEQHTLNIAGHATVYSTPDGFGAEYVDAAVELGSIAAAGGKWTAEIANPAYDPEDEASPEKITNPISRETFAAMWLMDRATQMVTALRNKDTSVSVDAKSAKNVADLSQVALVSSGVV